MIAEIQRIGEVRERWKAVLINLMHSDGQVLLAVHQWGDNYAVVYPPGKLDGLVRILWAAEKDARRLLAAGYECEVVGR
jgi:hypothetical protein